MTSEVPLEPESEEEVSIVEEVNVSFEEEIIPSEQSNLEESKISEVIPEPVSVKASPKTVTPIQTQ